MKIKVVYGIDMRVFRYNQDMERPDLETYGNMLSFIENSYEFAERSEFRVTFKDDEEEMTTISSLHDFQDAFIAAKEHNKKSLKLYVVSAVNDSKLNEQQEGVQPDEANKNEDDEKKESLNSPNKEPKQPSKQEIDAFFGDQEVITLLSDLFVTVFEALQESQFEVTFKECIQGIILSDDGHKYTKITSNKCWPYFMEQLLPKFTPQIEQFVVPMIRAQNGNMEMIKQWIPTILSMIRFKHSQCGNLDGSSPMFGMPAFTPCGPFGAGWRARGCRRGRGWRRHGHRGHHHHHRRHHGRRGQHGPPHHGMPPFFGAGNAQFEARQEPVVVSNDDDQIENESFEYDEELVAIMNMGFTDLMKIKDLLVEHHGNKQNVVQELVLSKN